MQFLKTLWNTIRYGNKKMALYVLLIVALFAGAAFLFASAYVNSAIPHALVGIAMIALDLFLLSRLVDEELDQEEKQEEEGAEEEVPAPSWADGVQHKTPSFRLGDAQDFMPEDEPEEEETEEQKPEKQRSSLPDFFGMIRGLIPEKKEKKQLAAEKKTAQNTQKDAPQKMEKKPDKKEKPPKGFKKVRVFPKDMNSKEQITMFLKFYKVKQNHITVLIDNSKKYDIKQCPAYLWRDVKKGIIHILLLEEPVREIMLPAATVHTLVYKRAVPAEPRKEYLELREPSLKSAIFSSYIPEYYDVGNGAFASAQQAKNLYQIAPDIQFSDKCAREVMDLLDLDFVVYDQYTKSDKFSEYFKAGHRYQVLLREKILEPDEYRDKMQELMRRMITAKISEDVFDDTIRQMVMYNMIGSDNGEFYRAQRAKYLADRQAVQQKGKKKKRK